MKKINLIIFIHFFIMGLCLGCGKVSMVGDLISPAKVDKQNLTQLPTFNSNKYNIPIVLTDNIKSDTFTTFEFNKKGETVLKILPRVRFTKKWWGIYIDNRLDVFLNSYKELKGKFPDQRAITKFKIAIVDPGHFKCHYHNGHCNGEIINESKLIILSLKAVNHDDLLPLLDHEWLHALGYQEGQVKGILHKMK